MAADVKEEKIDEVVNSNVEECSGEGDGRTAPVIPNSKQISVMDPIDTVFKIVNLAPAGGSSCNLNVPGQPQSSNGSLLNPETGSSKSQTPSILSKSRTSEWFANLFSPSKSRNNSSSTDTSRYYNVPRSIARKYQFFIN